jgi:hypothetical protein
LLFLEKILTKKKKKKKQKKHDCEEAYGSRSST